MYPWPLHVFNKNESIVNDNFLLNFNSENCINLLTARKTSLSSWSQKLVPPKHKKSQIRKLKWTPQIKISCHMSASSFYHGSTSTRIVTTIFSRLKTFHVLLSYSSFTTFIIPARFLFPCLVPPARPGRVPNLTTIRKKIPPARNSIFEEKDLGATGEHRTNEELLLLLLSEN